MIMSYDKSPYKFVCRDCGTEFIGNKEKSNDNWCVWKKGDKCEKCGSENIEMTPQ